MTEIKDPQKDTKQVEPKSYEQAVAELEKIVKDLEQGEVGLDDSIALFERGLFLSKWCDNKLAEVESKISVLNKDNLQVEKEHTLTD